MKIALQPDEKLLRDGGANLERGIETVGGELFLTDRRLYFRSHAFNLRPGATEIPLARVRGTRLCWTKFLKVVPLLPNSLAVQTADGAEYRFVLFGRRKWARAIEAQARLLS